MSEPRQTPPSLPERTLGDYWIYRNGGDFLLFDAGPVGPDELPAHAHSDLLGLEASWQGKRLFVDSGVFGYQDDEMRGYCRSSAAHNVLVVDGLDQCDMWSSFRMGYRGWPAALETGQTGDFAWARATHNAYRRVGVASVGRWVGCRPGGPWFCVDWAEGSWRSRPRRPAASRGTGYHQLISRLHVHPAVDVEQKAKDELRLIVGDRGLALHYLGAGGLSIAGGWFCPEMGERRRNVVLEWSAAPALPSLCGWWLAGVASSGRADLERTAGGEVRLHWTEHGEAVVLDPVGRALLAQ